jgi:hypothetical protein
MLAVAGSVLAGCYNFNNPVDPLNESEAVWQDLYVQDFDAAPLGTSADHAMLDLDRNWTPPQDTQASVQKGPSGDRALFLEDDANGAGVEGRIELRKDIGPVSKGRLRIEFDLAAVASSTVGTRFEVLDGETAVASIELAPATPTLSYNAGPSADTIAVLTEDQWYSAGFLLDLTEQRLSVFFEGNVDASGLDFSASAVDGFLLRTGLTGKAWVDDIHISATEP